MPLPPHSIASPDINKSPIFFFCGASASQAYYSLTYLRQETMRRVTQSFSEKNSRVTYISSDLSPTRSIFSNPNSRDYHYESGRIQATQKTQNHTPKDSNPHLRKLLKGSYRAHHRWGHKEHGKKDRASHTNILTIEDN